MIEMIETGDGVTFARSSPATPLYDWVERIVDVMFDDSPHNPIPSTGIPRDR